MDKKQTIEELEFLVKQKERSLQTVSNSPFFKALSAENLNAEIRIDKEAIRHLKQSDVTTCSEYWKQATNECPLTIIGLNGVAITGPVNDFFCGAAEREKTG